MNGFIRSICRSTSVRDLLRFRAYTTTSRRTVDLRSDTLTRPSTEMKKAMFAAEVGDDVYKEDATINELERVAAQLFGMEAALFVPSGTMGNLICLMSHCGGRGEELIIGAEQHVYVYEQAHFMQLASIGARVIPNEPDGTMRLESIEANIKDASDFHCAETKLICLENTHMNCGGIPLTNEFLNQVGQLSRKRNIAVHVDGARLFNAAVATNQSLADSLVNADSVSMCLSKGLGCPIGSVIGGTEEFISRAIRIRKSLGGGIRQGGFLAAAGLYALEHGHVWIQRDHVNAKILAEGILNLGAPDLIDIEASKMPQTNLVFVKTARGDGFEIESKLRDRGVLTIAFSGEKMRLVLHHDVHEEDVFYTLEMLKEIVYEMS